MGWLYTPRNKGIKNEDFFKGRIDGEGLKILDMAQVGYRTIYAALLVKDAAIGLGMASEDHAPFTIGVVINIDWRNRDYYNFGYKDMDETMGPCESECPRRILDQLTPLDELAARGIYTGSSLISATNWRNRCEEYLAKRKAIKLHRGLIIRTNGPLNFGRGLDGHPLTSADTFLITDAKRMHAQIVNPDGRFGMVVRLGRRQNLFGSVTIAEAWPRMN